MNEKTEQIAGMILDYLERNPDAGDTLEGISNWWLEIEGTESSVDEVAVALESLVKQGMVRSRESKGGNKFYSIDKQQGFNSNNFGN